MENRKLHSSFRRYGLEALIQADKAFRSVGSFLDGGVLQENIAVLLEKYGFPARLSWVENVGVIISCIICDKGLIADDQFYKKGTLLIPVHTRGFQN